jgi:hypothetical protein
VVNADRRKLGRSNRANLWQIGEASHLGCSQER